MSTKLISAGVSSINDLKSLFFSFDELTLEQWFVS